MAKFYKNPFAYNGDKEPIADGTQSSGKVSNEDGFTSDYELLKSDPNYRPVGRKEMNGIFNEITGALHQIQTQGAAEFEFDFDGYKKGAIVRYDGHLYLLNSDSYTEDEGPTTDPDSWLKLDILTNNKTITVGTGGDFPDLWNALSYARELIVPKSSLRLEIKVLSGYVFKYYQFLLDGEDLGFVDITSEGTIEINSSLFTQSLEPGCKPAFGAKNGGVLPVIKAKFQFTADSDRGRHGVAVLSGSKAIIGTGGGFLNAPGASLYADGLGSEIVAQSGYDASGSYYGILAQNMAKVQADGMTADSCGQFAIEAESGADVYARNATLTNAGGTAITATTSASVWADDSDLSNPGVGGADASENSIISINRALILNASEFGILSQGSSHVFAEGVKISGAGDEAISASTGGHVAAHQAEITNSPLAIKVATGSKIDARGANIVNTQKIEAHTGGEIIVDQAEITNNEYGEEFVFVANAAKISANDVLFRIPDPNPGVLNALIDMTRGSEIRLCGARIQFIGDEVSDEFPLPSYVTANTPSEFGIVWQSYSG